MAQALQFLELALISGFAALIIGAALSDWARFLIPNTISIAIVALFVPHAGIQLLGGASAWTLLWSLAVCLAVFAGGLFLFSYKVLGGGDVKLMAAIGLWAGTAHVAEFLLITTFHGGLLSLVFLMPGFRDRAAASGIDTGGGSISKARIPYGLAIATGAVVVCLRLMFEARG